MNRIERISAILIQLQSKPVVTGQEIAKRFKISLRTAYRDIRALEESGVPIIGEAGLGYSLVSGYKLPPIMFTKEEALSLITAEKIIEKIADDETYKEFESAVTKIKAVLKSEDKSRLQSMADHIEVFKNPYFASKQNANGFIQLVLKSIEFKKVLEINYYANYSQKNTQRKVEPVGIFFHTGYWYMIAFCWLRNDYRNFRMDRIQKCVISDSSFQKEHPSLKVYLKNMVKEKKDLKEVIIRMKNEYIRYLGDQKYYNGFISETKNESYTEMVFLTTSIDGFLRWYLMFSDRSEIIKPTALKNKFRDLLNKIQERI